MTPTAEQLAIIDAAVNTQDNLLIKALAGSAKTTTLDMLSRALPSSLPILSIAFNKAIAEAMTLRLPGNVRAKTINGLGHGVWLSALGRTKVRLNTKKTYELTQTFIKDGKDRDLWELFPQIMDIVKGMKIQGYIPQGKFVNYSGLLTRDEMLDTFEEEQDEYAFDAAEAILGQSIKESYDGHIDFDDQIYMPTLFGGAFPKFPLVLVDEAQDLSPLNHAMLRKLVTKRIIAVGDPWQSIYGFRGAVTNGMEELKRTFSMLEFGLSISFRCPKAVVRSAWFRVPHMKWADWAEEGEVVDTRAWNLSEPPEGGAIICRNNAPLFRLALSMIRHGRNVKLLGSDVGPKLIKIMEKFGDRAMPQDQVMRAIEAWEVKAEAKSKSKGATADRAECMRVFAGAGPSLGDAINYAKDLFARDGSLSLMTAHKAKGGEWDTVYHLDPWRVPSSFATSPEAMEQELNIKYVINTRARKRLIHVNMNELGAVA